MRNPQVARKLNQWRREQTTYFSYFPQDIIGLISVYLPPHLWAEELSLTLQGKLLLSTKLDYRLMFLADGSWVVAIPDYCCFYLEAGTKHFVQLTDLPSNFYGIAADPCFGFWYTSSQKTSLDGPNYFRHFDPKTQTVLKEILLPTPYRHHFAVTPDGILVFSPGSIQEFTFQGQLIQQTKTEEDDWLYRNGVICRHANNKYIYRNRPWETNPPIEIAVTPTEPPLIPLRYDPTTKDLYLATQEGLFVQVDEAVFKLIALPPDIRSYLFRFNLANGRFVVTTTQNNCLTIYAIN